MANIPSSVEAIVPYVMVAFALFVVPGSWIRISILANSLDNFTNVPRAQAKIDRFARKLKAVSAVWLVLSLLIIWGDPANRPWAYASLGLVIGFWGRPW